MYACNSVNQSMPHSSTILERKSKNKIGSSPKNCCFFIVNSRHLRFLRNSLVDTRSRQPLRCDKRKYLYDINWYKAGLDGLNKFSSRSWGLYQVRGTSRTGLLHPVEARSFFIFFLRGKFIFGQAVKYG